MQNQAIKAQVLAEIPDVYLHSFSKGTKVLIQNDRLTLSILPDSKFIITVGNFVQKFDTENGLFFKVNNGPSSTYFFVVTNQQLHAITMSRYSGTNDFEPEINKLTEVYSYEKAKTYHIFQKLIEENYPDPDVSLVDNSKVNQVIEKCGSWAGTGFQMLGGWAATAVDYVGNFIEPKVSPGQMSQNNKQKIENFTNTTKNITSKVTGAVVTVSEPVIKKGLQIGSNVSQSMQTSQYSGVRTLNGVASSTWNAGQKAAKGFWKGLCDFGGALSNQSSKIWNKKFYSAQNQPLVPQNEQKLNETPGQNILLNKQQFAQ